MKKRRELRRKKEESHTIKQTKIHNNLNSLEKYILIFGEQPQQLRKIYTCILKTKQQAYTYKNKTQNERQMVHMPNLESWEWGLKIFDGAPTLTTHVDHLPSIHKTHKHRAQSQKLGTSNSSPSSKRQNDMQLYIGLDIVASYPGSPTCARNN